MATTPATSSGSSSTATSGGTSTGAGGSSSASTALFTQPTFDPRIRKLTAPFTYPYGHTDASQLNISTGIYGGEGGSVIQRGFMMWDMNSMSTAGYGTTKPPVVQFLFNPSTISANYSIAQSGAQASIVFPTSSTSAALAVPMQQSINFNIYFDRTYELNTPSIANSKPWAAGSLLSKSAWTFGDLGVLVDIYALMQFTGMFISTAAVSQNSPYTPSGGSTSGSGSGSTPSGTITTFTGGAGSIPQGAMVACLSYVFFSGTTNNASLQGATTGTTATTISPIPRGLYYYGWIDSWTVQYTHFTNLMVPMRCVVDIDFTLIPATSSTTPAAAAITSSQNQLQTIQSFVKQTGVFIF